MDPRKLLYFATVIEHGSFKKAARELHISQPALSTSMNRFERSLGDKLLDRGPTGVSPTPLGEALYSHARLIRDELEIAEKRLLNVDDRDEDVITFGTLPSLASSIIPTAVCRWREKYGAKILRVVEKNQLGLLLSLLRGEVDFIVAQTELYGFLDGMRQRVMFRDCLHIIARSDHPIMALDTPGWSDLAQFPWVVQMVGRHRTVLDKLLAAANVTLPEQLTECVSPDFIKRLVVGSDSLALLPASAVAADVREGKIGLVEISEPLLNRNIAVLFREGVVLTDADRDLLAEIETVGSSLDDELVLNVQKAAA